MSSSNTTKTTGAFSPASQRDVKVAINLFAETIGGDPPGLVVKQPVAGVTFQGCIDNVLKVITERGGNPIFGWTFQLCMSQQYGEYLVATHHAVWQRPDGALVDITPLSGRAAADPIMIGSSVLFSFSEHAEPKRIGRYVVPLPLRYFAITDSTETHVYVETLRAEEAEKHSSMCEGFRE